MNAEKPDSSSGIASESILRLVTIAMLVIAMLTGAAPNATLSAQEVPELFDEYDRWHGSSMGIRIERRDGSVFVEQVHNHVAEHCPLQSGDKIVSIGSMTVSAEKLGELSKVLAETDPDSRLEMAIERDGKPMAVQLVTFRKELVDIAEIVETLQNNKIIKDHLNETGRPEFLKTVAERMFAAVQESKTPRMAAEAINAIVDEIDISHTAIIPGQSFSQLTGKQAGDLGFTLQRHAIDGKDKYFVIDRMPGSAGFESGILLGDEIVRINGVPIEESKRLILAGQEHRHRAFSIEVKLSEDIQLEFRRRQNGTARTISLRSRKAVPAEEVLNFSARVIERDGNEYGYVRLWNLMSLKTSTIATKIMEEEFAECDMLIFDLRGRGGLIPAVLMLEKVMKESKTPIIAITDDLTRSAKEMLSLLIKRHSHITVVGQKTAGAVTGATMRQLPSGNGFMFPVVSSDTLKRFTDGVVLEGVGVEPDIYYDFQIPYCGGNDRLLEGAIETAGEQLQELLDSIIVP